MQINTNSWHYKWWRWTYWFYNSSEPTRTNLCRYTQRIFWVTLGTLILGSAIAVCLCVIVSGIAVGIWQHPWIALAVLGGILAIIAIMAGAFAWFDSETKEVADAWVEAKTQGICPLIEFTSSPTKKD
jgi:hypothetical protein